MSLGDQASEPIFSLPWVQLDSLFTFDMFGLFLQVFIISWPLKLKIDIRPGHSVLPNYSSIPPLQSACLWDLGSRCKKIIS